MKVINSIGELIDLLAPYSRGASLYMIPPRDGDNIQQVQVMDVRATEHGYGLFKPAVFTIGGHGPVDMLALFEIQQVREAKDGGRKTVGLSWRDVQRIVQIADELCNTLEYDKVQKMGEEGYYTEILEQFNKEKYGNTQE